MPDSSFCHHPLSLTRQTFICFCLGHGTSEDNASKEAVAGCFLVEGWKFGDDGHVQHEFDMQLDSIRGNMRMSWCYGFSLSRAAAFRSVATGIFWDFLELMRGLPPGRRSRRSIPVSTVDCTMPQVISYNSAISACQADLEKGPGSTDRNQNLLHWNLRVLFGHGTTKTIGQEPASVQITKAAQRATDSNDHCHATCTKATPVVSIRSKAILSFTIDSAVAHTLRIEQSLFLSLRTGFFLQETSTWPLILCQCAPSASTFCMFSIDFLHWGAFSMV